MTVRQPRTKSNAAGTALAGAAATLMMALAACAPAVTDEGTAATPTPQASHTAGTPQAARDQATAITEEDVVGTWVNHQDTEIQQQIRFTADHRWTEDQHGTENIYHGTWEITGDRTVMLHDYEEEIAFTPGNDREFTVISFDHVLTKSE